MLGWKINYQSKLNFIYNKASALIKIYHPLQKITTEQIKTAEC